MSSRNCSCLASALLTVAVLVAPSFLSAQVADLPIKPGLWDTQVSVNGGEPISRQYCFVAGTTLSDYLTASNKGVPGAQCSISNKKKTLNEVSYDTACTSTTMSSKGHLEVRSLDPDHFAGSSHTTVTRTSPGGSMEINRTFKASFSKPDCGSVKPLIVPSSPAR